MTNRVIQKMLMNKLAVGAIFAGVAVTTLLLPTSFGGIGTWSDAHKAPGYVSRALKRQFNTLSNEDRGVATDQIIAKFASSGNNQPSEFILESGLVVDLKKFENNLAIIQAEETAHFDAEGKMFGVMYGTLALFYLGMGLKERKKTQSSGRQGPGI